MTVRVLLVSGRAGIEESLRDDPGAGAYWVERRPPDLVVPAEVSREFAIAIVDFDTCPDGLAMARALRASKTLEVIAISGPERERIAVESLRSGIYDYLVWPPSEPGEFWGMLAACVKKVKPAEPEFPIAFGPYTLLSRLGVGGMAEVFLAETGSPARKLVVKRMLQSLVGDEFVAMFMDEARISSVLVHPNIVRVHDFGRVDESLYIAMEYVPGQNLEQLRLALAGPFPPSLACYIVAEFCAGLGHAHTKTDASGTPQGIVHRDVNPPNVLIADDGRVMITDFGIAKAAHRYYETSSGTLKGKFEYMSPEQANGKPVDRRADIFCAGLVFYELLTGTRPFMAATPIETLFLIQECKPVAPSYWNARLPKVLDDICMKALAKDPADRYSESAELERDLREFARGSMNPGPRDLAVFTKSVGKAQPAEQDVEIGVVPAGIVSQPATTSDGKVTALLLHKRKKDGARTGEGATEDPTGRVLPRPPGVSALADAAAPAQPSAKLSPFVRAVLDEETPAAVPAPARPPIAAPVGAPANPTPPATPPPVRATPRPVRATPPPVRAPAAATVSVEAGPDAARRPEPSRTITADAPGATFLPEATPSPLAFRDETVPGVLADLERISAAQVRELPDSPSRSGGTLIVPPSPKDEQERTISAELFPSAKNQERKRLKLQIGAAVAGGLVIAIFTFLFVGPRVVSLVTASPTPYPSSPTPFAMVSATPVPSVTAIAVSTATPAASVEMPTPSAVVRVSPTPMPVPSRTVIAAATATPIRTAAPVAKGTLSVWVDGWATVEIDGRPGPSAPFVGIPLSAGKHRLVLTQGAKRREVEVMVQAGKEARYSIPMVAPP